MIEIDWKKDYRREFVCPKCQYLGLKLNGMSRPPKYPNFSKRMFGCPACGRKTSESCENNWIDGGFEVNWRTDYKVGEFACPNIKCNARQVRLAGKRNTKRSFICAVCGATSFNSTDLRANVISHFSGEFPVVKPFNFSDNEWDLRAINTSVDDADSRFIVNFQNISVEWFKLYVKQYVYQQCKLNKPCKSIQTKISSLRVFSIYIAQSGITDITQITRKYILSFLTWDETGIEAKRQRLGSLRDFFWAGDVEGWFTLALDLIRDEDFPKRRRRNPDPISDTVREIIEQSLHKLPDPIARMWIICFFTAMRPVELALLRKDCLVQEGSHWKLRWWRKKGKNEHEVPITRVIAKVVQEQIDYIEQAMGTDWEYLFCHYGGITKDGEDPSFPNLRPIRRVLPDHHNPFNLAIRCLIQSEKIRDDNDQLATFKQRLVRHTRLTELFSQGHDLAVVSAWAGHKSLAVTSVYYTQISCDQIVEEAGVIQVALFNAEGHVLNYESLPKSFWQNPRAHELALTGDHINTPIYGFCGLPLDEDCEKFRACYTCPCFFATLTKLPLYIKTCEELRMKESRAKETGQDVLVEQFARQADQLDNIIAKIRGTG